MESWKHKPTLLSRLDDPTGTAINILLVFYTTLKVIVAIPLDFPYNKRGKFTHNQKG